MTQKEQKDCTHENAVLVSDEYADMEVCYDCGMNVSMPKEDKPF